MCVFLCVFLLRLANVAVVQAKPPLRLLELCGGVGVIGLSLAHAVADTKVTLLSTDPWHIVASKGMVIRSSFLMLY